MRVRAVLVAFLLAAGLAWPSPADTGAAERFVYQSAKLSPLLDSMTYVITGKRTPKGCLFVYPELVLGPGELAREQRDIGIDIAGCTKLVEEGVPTSDDFPVADASLKDRGQLIGNDRRVHGRKRAGVEWVSRNVVRELPRTASDGRPDQHHVDLERLLRDIREHQRRMELQQRLRLVPHLEGWKPGDYMLAIHWRNALNVG